MFWLRYRLSSFTTASLLLPHSVHLAFSLFMLFSVPSLFHFHMNVCLEGFMVYTHPILLHVTNTFNWLCQVRTDFVPMGDLFSSSSPFSHPPSLIVHPHCCAPCLIRRSASECGCLKASLSSLYAVGMLDTLTGTHMYPWLYLMVDSSYMQACTNTAAKCTFCF